MGWEGVCRPENSMLFYVFGVLLKQCRCFLRFSGITKTRNSVFYTFCTYKLTIGSFYSFSIFANCAFLQTIVRFKNAWIIWDKHLVLFQLDSEPYWNSQPNVLQCDWDNSSQLFQGFLRFSGIVKFQCFLFFPVFWLVGAWGRLQVTKSYGRAQTARAWVAVLSIWVKFVYFVTTKVIKEIGKNYYQVKRQ